MSYGRFISFIPALLLMASVSVYAADKGNVKKESSSKVEKGLLKDPALYSGKIEELLSSMSVREKFAQLMIVVTNIEDSKPAQFKELDRLVEKERVGGIILDDSHAAFALERLNELQRKVALPNSRNSGLPLLITTDGEWGLSMRFPEYPFYPRQMQLGALINSDLVYEMGLAVGKECREVNVLVNYAPDIDVNINAANPVINTRSFGQDKGKVAQWGIAYMKGMQDAGILTCAKHFPGHGDTNVDSHKGLPVLEFDGRRLDDIELYPFKKLCEAGVDMVMIGHLSVPALDASGTPASISYPIITGLLKEKMGYKGIVITDALGMKGIAEGMEPDMICLESYRAGSDILLMPDEPVKALDLLVREYKSGNLPEEELDAKVKKVLALKAKLGMFEKEYSPFVDTVKFAEKCQLKEHLALIQKIADRSVTVVSNNGVLPLHEKPHHRLAVQDKNPGKRANKVAYIGFGLDSTAAADENNTAFATQMMEYTDIDTFYVAANVSMERLGELKGIIKGYKSVILGVHNCGNLPVDNYAVDMERAEFFAEWAEQQSMVVAYFGNPYALNIIPGFSNYKAFIVGYSNKPYNQIAAAKIIFGAVAPQGVLPVDAGEFKTGFKAQVNPWFEHK